MKNNYIYLNEILNSSKNQNNEIKVVQIYKIGKVIKVII
jgi:hypothetical protein